MHSLLGFSFLKKIKKLTFDSYLKNNEGQSNNINLTVEKNLTIRLKMKVIDEIFKTLGKWRVNR